MHYSTLTSKGQTTIPVEIREQFHLKAGDRLEFISSGEFITIIPVKKSIKSLKGLLKKPEKSLSCKEMNKIIKGRSS